jgi:cytosine/adenosine deaminase-related metal-dependent hydrolase
MSRLASLILGGIACFGSLSAQETRPVAITNARILSMDGAVIEHGNIIIRDGKIAAVGAKAAVPPGSKVIDAEGGSVMPGLVSAWSLAGVDRVVRQQPQAGRGRRGGRRGRGQPQQRRRSNARNTAATKVADNIYARQEIFGQLLSSGVTTLAVHPTGEGFVGQAALLNPATKSSEDLAIDDELYITVIPGKNTGSKEMVKTSLEAAQKIVEERKKPKEAPKAAEEKPKEEKPKAEDKPAAEKPAEKKDGDDPKPEDPKPDQPKPDQPKPGEKGPAKAPTGATPPAPRKKPKDPNAEALADLLEGKRRAFVQLATANDLAHYLSSIGEHKLPGTIVAASSGSSAFAGFRRRGGGGGGSLHLMLDELKKLNSPVLLNPNMGTKEGTDVLFNLPASLTEAGIEVGFLIGDNPRQVREIFYRLMELVRHGMDRELALQAVTRVPAKMLDLEEEVGSISVGKQANLLLFSGDPLNPSSQMKMILYRGHEVGEER